MRICKSDIGGMETYLSNRACHPGGHYWEHYPGALSLSQVNVTHLKIGHTCRFHLRVPDLYVFLVRLLSLIDQFNKSQNAPAPYPQCPIQNRNVHISVLNGALWDMKQVHSGICELGQLGKFQCIWQGTRILVPDMAARWHPCGMPFPSDKKQWQAITDPCSKYLQCTGPWLSARLW